MVIIGHDAHPATNDVGFKSDNHHQCPFDDATTGGHSSTDVTYLYRFELK